MKVYGMTKVIELKDKNIQKIRSCFYQGKYWTKNDLANQCELSLALTTNLLTYLQENKEIIYEGDAASTGGRKSKIYRINPDCLHVLKVILHIRKGKNYIDCSVVNALDEILVESHKVNEDFTIEELDQIILNVIGQDELIRVIAMSIPGVVYEGVIGDCDMKELSQFDITTHLTMLTNKKIVVENDMNAAALGIHRMKPEMKHLAMIYQPDDHYAGVGLILNGQIYNGAFNGAGEVRFLPVLDEETQTRLLKENPRKLLQIQMDTLCSVLNPQIIGWYSEAFEGDISASDSTIPAYLKPTYMKIDNLWDCIGKGLIEIGINKYLEERL